jgi:hypothetical protein
MMRRQPTDFGRPVASIRFRTATPMAGPLGSKAAGSKPRSDQRLVATHRRFDQRALAVIGGNLPDPSSPRSVIIARWRSRWVGAPGSPLGTAVDLSGF